MLDLTLSFEVHQPLRIRKFRNFKNVEDIYERYVWDEKNKEIFERVTNKCYLPATKILLECINSLRDVKVSFSITGLWIEQAMKWRPELIDLFKQIPKKCIEFLDETYYHSLASLFRDKGEFVEQIKEHNKTIFSIFGRKPKVFVNTEMIYNNRIAKIVEELGYKAIFTEGHPGILGWRSPNYVYKPPSHISNIKILLRNRQLTDDIGYRFSARWWKEWPLTAEKYTHWLASCNGQCINIFLDYETFGEHHWEDTGILWFLKALPYKIVENENIRFSLPSEVVEKHNPIGIFDVFELSTISWADIEMDTSAWIGNDVQFAIFKEIEKMESIVKSVNRKDFLRVWRIIQASDLLHHLCTKWLSDGTVHAYFSYFNNVFEGMASIFELLLDFKENLLKYKSKYSNLLR